MRLTNGALLSGGNKVNSKGKGFEFMGKEPKWVKLTDLEASVPPLHTNSYTWGVATKETIGVENVSLFVSEIQPGGRAEMDKHPDSEQLNFVLSGRGKAVVNGKEFLMEPNGCLFVPQNAEHKMEVIGKETLRTLVVFAPPLRR